MTDPLTAWCLQFRKLSIPEILHLLRLPSPSTRPIIRMLSMLYIAVVTMTKIVISEYWCGVTFPFHSSVVYTRSLVIIFVHGIFKRLSEILIPLF